MKKKSTSQSAFFNLRILIGLFLSLAGGSLLAFTGNYEYVGTAPTSCGLLVGSGLTCGWRDNTWSAQLATNTVQYTFAMSQPAPKEFALFETHDPWGSTFIKDAITATGYNYQVFMPDQLAGFDFSQYRVVILNWDDTFLNEFITPYTRAIRALEAYVGAGGAVWVQAAIQGNPGVNFQMPFEGQGNGANFGNSDPIVDPASPMMIDIPNPMVGGGHCLPVTSHTRACRARRTRWLPTPTITRPCSTICNWAAPAEGLFLAQTKTSTGIARRTFFGKTTLLASAESGS